jgi:hypothetical protein
MQAYFFKQDNSGRAQMPRPKTELTNNNKTIGVRLTETQYKEWKRIGGAVWLRKQLAQSINQKHVQKPETS